ncbi:MAG: 23S rRNA (pseudouridine(1915)-N(3))-methyltransferase RlmH [Victivallaceae bacterium]
MLFKIIAVGKLKDKALAAKSAEFVKRIQAFGKLEIVELKDGAKEKECARILEALEKERGLIIVLSEDGKELTSQEFSGMIASADRKMIFVIGGPCGLSDEVKKRGDAVLSLSRMTFTHEMARFFLTEQIYRAITIAKGIKYHND